MSLYCLSYPITPEVRTARAKFSQIAQNLSLPAQGRSELEIVRLLDNAHYEHVERLLKFINHNLPQAGSIGERLLQQTGPFQFNQSLAEMFLFSHLWDRLGKRVVAIVKGPSDKGADIEVSWNKMGAKIEVYSPIDLMGFQLIEKHVPPLLKYLDIARGFDLKVSIAPLDTSVAGVWYPYWVPDEGAVLGWLQTLGGRAKTWLSERHPAPHLRIEGPGEKIEMDLELKELTDDPADRTVIFVAGTRSTDTRLFFECGTPHDTERSQWGRKLRSKLKKRQAGPPMSNIMRVFIVDFAQADTAWPEFICWPRVADRLAKTVRLLVDDIPAPAPYDVLIPAQLGLGCCFGSSIWIEASMELAGKDFIRAAGMDLPCVRQVQDQRPAIDEV